MQVVQALTSFLTGSSSPSPEKITRTQAPTSTGHKQDKRREGDVVIDNHSASVEMISSGHGLATAALTDIPPIPGATNSSQTVRQSHADTARKETSSRNEDPARVLAHQRDDGRMSESLMNEPRRRGRRESRGSAEPDTRSRTRYHRDDTDDWRRKVQELEQQNAILQRELRYVQRERKDIGQELSNRDQQVAKLSSDLASANQRVSDVTSHHERQGNELIAVKNQFRRAEEHYSITRAQLSERTAELQSAQLFINQADSLSGAEVITMVNALNAEILQSAAFMADSLDYTPTPPLTAEDTSNAQDTIGEDLVQALLSQRGQEHFDPTLVQLALQVGFVESCRRVVDSWTLRVVDEQLKNIYREIFEKEKQSVAGRWRSVLQAHATPPDIPTFFLEYINQWTTETLILAGWSRPESSTLPDNLQNRLSMIVTLTLRLRTAIGESVTSMDIKPYTIKAGSEFDPSEMDDTYADEREPVGRSKVGERVAGSTELGLYSLAKVNQITQEILMLKPKVILSSALKEV